MITYTQTGVLAGLRTAAIIAISIAGGLTAFFTVAAFFGDTWWLFDYAANYRWQMFWLLILAAIVYVVISGGFLSVIFVVAALINAWLIAPLWFGSQPEPARTTTFSVVQVDLSPNVDDSGVVSRWLLGSGADLLLVSGTTAQRVEALTRDGSPYRILSAPEAAGRLGVVILAVEEWPVEEVLTQGFGEPVYKVTIGEGAAATEIVTAWGTTGSNPQDAERLKARLDTIAQIAASTSNPVAVMGNLGATRWTSGITALRDSHGLRDATEGSGYAPTWPISGIPVIGRWIGIPIDVVLMSSEITPVEITTGPDIGAGHMPILVEVARSAKS